MKFLRIYMAQRGRCFHCGEPMLTTVARKGLDGRYDTGWTREHVVPLALGGRNWRNQVLAHLHCNSRRGDTPPTDEMIERAEMIFCEAHGRKPRAGYVKHMKEIARRFRCMRGQEQRGVSAPMAAERLAANPALKTVSAESKSAPPRLLSGWPSAPPAPSGRGGQP